jgi:Protein of unknown function (DUF1068)
MAGGSSGIAGLNPTLIRAMVMVLGLGLAGYIVGPPLYWHVVEALGGSSGCPPCTCDCSSQPLLSIPHGTGYLFRLLRFILQICSYIVPKSDFFFISACRIEQLFHFRLVPDFFSSLALTSDNREYASAKKFKVLHLLCDGCSLKIGG